MSYNPPSEVGDQIDPQVADILASAQLYRRVDNPGAREFTFVVTDVGTRSTSWFGPFPTVPSNLTLPPGFGRNLRVRVFESSVIRGRAAYVGVSPRFRRTRTGIELLDLHVATALSEKLRELRPKYSVTRRRKSLVPRANELVVDPRPLYKWDGSTFTFLGTWNLTTHQRTWTGVRTPNYAALKAKGKLPINPHHVLIQNVRDFGSYFQEEWLDLPGYGTGTFEPYSYRLGTSDYGPTVNIAHASTQRNKAIERLRDKAIGETSNLAETFATMNQTFAMIGNLIMRIVTSFRNLKVGNLVGAVTSLIDSRTFGKFKRKGAHRLGHLTGDLANDWLELQFGWKPLLQDIHYALESIAKLDISDASIVTVRSSASSKDTQKGILRPNAGPNPPVVGSYVAKTKTTTRLGIRFRIADALRAFLGQSGVTNSVSLAWELLPFSFVVDWFLPVGSYLETIHSWDGLEFMEGYETTFTRMEVAYQRSYTGYDYPGGHQTPPTRYTRLEGLLYKESVLLDREILSSFPSMLVPVPKNPLSVIHALDALSLLHQSFDSPRTWRR